MDTRFFIILGSSYILGSVPFGLIIGKLRGIDIRIQGSGNIGATNVQRTLGWGPGLASFVLDMAKGFVPVFVASQFGYPPWMCALAGLVVLLGHCWSVFLLFKGGKGISTTLGVVAALDWRIGLLCAALWLVQLLIFRYVSLASIISASLMPFGFLLGKFDLSLFGVAILIGLIDVLKHLPNIKRLQEGTEFKFGEKAIERASES